MKWRGGGSAEASSQELSLAPLSSSLTSYWLYLVTSLTSLSYSIPNALPLNSLYSWIDHSHRSKELDTQKGVSKHWADGWMDGWTKEWAGRREGRKEGSGKMERRKRKKEIVLFEIT